MSMDLPSLIFTVIVYIVLAIFLVGFIARIWIFAKTPAPLKITLTPAPIEAKGVWLRMFQEVFLFKSLFKSHKIIWLAGYIFHVGLALVFIKHLRFFFVGTPSIIQSFVAYEMFPGIIMLVGLAFLFVLRMVIDRTFYISILTDYFLLVLLTAIALSGVVMKYFLRADVIYVKRFLVGIMSFNPAPMPTDLSFLVHFSFVLILFLYFPFSKLMHAGGIFFSPTRNQIDNSRDKRHITPWAAS
jgi:nitrate reductase gamma subunit